MSYAFSALHNKIFFFAFTCLTLGIHAQLWQLVLFSKHLNISLSTFRQELTAFSGPRAGWGGGACSPHSFLPDGAYMLASFTPEP